MASRATALDPKAAATKEAKSSVQPAAAENSTDAQIATLAYRLWQERGCPIGSPEEDWFQAESELRSRESAVTK